MTLQINNGKLQATFDTKGAELKSLYDSQSQKEWMWQADSAFWAKTSPILFPIVGGLTEDTYIFDNKQYKLPRHGFARDMEFDIRKHETDSVVFGLASSDTTKKLFPFEFDLEVEYQLENNTLTTTYRVKNSSDDVIYFSLGAHPAFAIDVDAKKSFSDYRLIFDNDATLHLHPLHNNLLQKETVDLELENGVLPLSYSLFANDALVMTDMKSQKIVLSNSKDRETLIFTFSNFPYFGIWSAKNANFVCLEPWAGVADFEGHNQEFIQKFGINKLDSDKTWSAAWQVEVSC